MWISVVRYRMMVIVMMMKVMVIRDIEFRREMMQ